MDGRPWFRTVGQDLELVRAQRLSFLRAARFGVAAAAPRLQLEMVGGRWLERYERRVATGERRERTLEIHRYRSNPETPGLRISPMQCQKLADAGP